MLFEKFLTQYTKELIKLNDIEYDIQEGDIQDIVDNVMNNYTLWEFIDECVNQQLDKYAKEEE